MFCKITFTKNPLSVLIFSCILCLTAVASCSKNSDDELTEPIDSEEQNLDDDLEGESMPTEFSDYPTENEEELGSSIVTSEAAVEEIQREDQQADERSIVNQEGEQTYQNPILSGVSDTSQTPEIPERENPDAIAMDSNFSPPEKVSSEYAQNPSNSESTNPQRTYSTSSNDGEIDHDGEEYIVQPGDTLRKISLLVLGSSEYWKDLAVQNRIANPDLIMPGDIIHFPKTTQSDEFQSWYRQVQVSSVVVEPGDSLSKISRKLFGKASYWRSLWQLNRDQIADPNRIQGGQLLRYIDPSTIKQRLSQKRWKT